jgi:hypothetical protein
MGGGCTGVSAEGGKEGDEGLLGIGCADTRDTLITGGSKDEEPDAASRRKHWLWLAGQARSTA